MKEFKIRVSDEIVYLKETPDKRSTKIFKTTPELITKLLTSGDVTEKLYFKNSDEVTVVEINETILEPKPNNTYSVLIVDDSMPMRKMLEKIITSEGYVVVDLAADGYNAVIKYKKHNPDLVLLDISMPECDGITALKMIKDFDANAKIIMVSAIDDKNAVIDAMKSGALDYVIKPFDKENVLAALHRVIEK